MEVEHWAKLGDKQYRTELVDGVQRFPRNRILDDLLTAATAGNKLDLNEIVIRYRRGLYTKEEMKGLYLNIGYSVCGISDLSIFEDEKMDSCCWQGHPGPVSNGAEDNNGRH